MPERREQMGQRLDGLGLEGPFGHGVAEVAHDLDGSVRPPLADSEFQPRTAGPSTSTICR